MFPSQLARVSHLHKMAVTPSQEPKERRHACVRNPHKHVLCCLVWFAFGVMPPLVTCRKDDGLPTGERLSNGRRLFPCPSLATPATRITSSKHHVTTG